jgi:hypothetical protein
MNTDTLGTQQLYEDAAYLHLIHTGHAVPWDRFKLYWEDQDLIK